MSHQPCDPPFRPSTGHEDPWHHSVTAGCLFYTVGVGYVPGIYTDEGVAREQVNGFSDGKWKKSPTYDGAVAIWNKMCERYHTHDNSSPGSSPPESPAPSPSPPSPAPRTPRQTPSRPLPPPVVRVHQSAQSPTSPRSSRNPMLVPPAIRVALPTSPSKSATPRVRTVLRSPPSAARPLQSRPAPPVKVESQRHPGRWREGETLWGIEGIPLLFEDRYALIDHISAGTLSPARVMETRNRRKLEAFVGKRVYVREQEITRILREGRYVFRRTSRYNGDRIIVYWAREIKQG
ncbi:hypothetical protein B0H14DRAFT_3465085 [Mycena olivaceomarginata]|nr:hypothetical protein B0H14DRAFT_3465085 [Mycena olivaceomarginata]